MLVIRLFRTGKKNQPSYKVVVCDKRNAPSRGRFVEEVGFYNPITKQRLLKRERILHWISVGAKPSDTVHNMMVSEKVIEAKKIPKHKASKKAAPEAQAAEQAPPAEQQAEALEKAEAASEAPAEAVPKEKEEKKEEGA